MDRYLFPAIFERNENGGYTITFPDLSIVTEGDNLSHALNMAKEALELHLYGLEEDHDPIPEPTPPEQVEVPRAAFVTVIEVYMPPVREEMAHKAVNTTVTLPRWLKNAAKEHGLNLSEVLQYAVKERIGIHERN
ncbi:type II toxin-antitoxin system HicB family antitoxin [Alicyclobacillus kakegawensis]|uniref:type II toxin-antitoxin system HicB family antitoxin n=1 Tax=Alicyclobacillus kakegawensis TaxID=392012 RepID=UPI0008300E14|nr:type II toxin-antitoxin system HicB family antitoxin [Alicyclobacillus kakegawensis]